ncbi:hypothetical protein AB3N58_06815 [Leptospira sp. WS60.C2]
MKINNVYININNFRIQIRFNYYNYYFKKSDKFQCFEVRRSGREKKIISFSLNLNKHELLFVNFGFIRDLESKGNSIIVFDDCTMEEKKYTSNLWEVWKKIFSMIFRNFSKSSLELISDFCDADNLQSRLLLQLAKNYEFEKLIRITPFLAYLEVMFDYLYVKFGESNLGSSIKKNISFYEKLTPNSLNFRYFGFFNSLVENEEVKSNLNKLREIDLESIFYEKQGSLEFLFPSGIDQSNDFLKINISSGLAGNYKEFSDSDFIYGIGAKVFYNYLIFGLRLFLSANLFPNRIYFLSYFGCLKVISLDLEKKEVSEKFQFDNGRFIEFLLPDNINSIRLFYFKIVKSSNENDYKILISKELGDIISFRSSYHAREIYINEIKKFKDFIPDFLVKIIQSVYVEKAEYFDLGQDLSNLGTFRSMQPHITSFNVFELLNENLNLIEISSHNTKLALVIISYFKKNECFVSNFDKYRITSMAKSEILKEIVEDDDVREIILKFSVNCLIQIHFDDLVYIAKNSKNRKLINSLPEVTLLIADLMFNSSKNNYDNLSKRLVLQLYHLEKKHAYLQKKYIDSKYEDEEIIDEIDSIDNILSTFLFDYIEVSDSLPTGRMIESVEMIQEIINDGWRNINFVDHFEFPEPPLLGTNSIVPIRNSTDLNEEGKVQINCCYSYVNRVISNRYYFYRCNKYERCTIGIVWNEEKSDWEIEQISSKSNKRPKKRSLEYIEKWFNSEVSRKM